MKTVGPLLTLEPLTDTTICDTRIPAGTRLLLLLRGRPVCSTASGEFEPRAVAGDDGDQERNVKPQKYFAGVRRWPPVLPRRNLAFLEAKTALAMIARNFEIELDDFARPGQRVLRLHDDPQGAACAARSARRTDRSIAAGCGVLTAATGDPGYALSASSEDEHERLGRQADRYEPFTRRLLRARGDRAGDAGARRRLRPGRCQLPVRRAGRRRRNGGRSRARRAGARDRASAGDRVWGENVEFVPGDFRDVELAGGPFDAVVGRLVLMYQGDPAAAVAGAARHVRPGGVVVFAEMCMHMDSFLPKRSMVSWPPTPASEQLNEWIHANHGKARHAAGHGHAAAGDVRAAGLLPNRTSTARSPSASARRRPPHRRSRPQPAARRSLLPG